MTNPATRGHILFADDEPDVRSAISRLLHAQGFACTCVASGAEVIEQLRQRDFDALISDLEMPGNDRLSLIESVPQFAAGLPVVVLTGKPSVETAARSVRLPVVAYLTKPPDFAELAEILDEAIFEYRAFRAIRAGHRRLRDWEAELAGILEHYRATAHEPDSRVGHYLRLSLRHAILVLSELEQAARALENSTEDRQSALHHLDREVALRRAVDVLRRTKQNFKSKELAELRLELERVIAQGEPSEAPAEN